MKYRMFKKLDILSYVKRVSIKYRPGMEGTEACTELIRHLDTPRIRKKFPIEWNFSIYEQPQLPVIEFEMVDGQIKSINPLNKQLDEVHSMLDTTQYFLHYNRMKTSLEAKE
eukprot:GHVL01003508.1.p1 GENE.GHVL01003508.1~~GHVL01003508.1.p1  ORF type:complete len:112 (+),score=14.07 GHVL01003508.1:262-597(+)